MVTSSGRRALWWVVAALAIFGCWLFGAWARVPLHDAVPVGIDYAPTTFVPPGAPRLLSVRVECNSLFAAGSRRAGTPLPSLPVQPPNRPELAFQRVPCELVHGDARKVLVLDTAMTVLGLGACFFLLQKRQPGLLCEPSADPVIRRSVA